MTPEERLLWALERLAQAQRVLLWRASWPLGLTPTQALLLLHLRARGGVRLKDLGQALDLRLPTLSETVKALEAKGFVERERDPKDARAFLLRLTPLGEETLKALEGWAQPLLLALRGKETALEPLLQAIARLYRLGVIGEARLCLTCRFFQPPAYCALLEEDLREIRLDCPDHQPQEADIVV